MSSTGWCFEALRRASIAEHCYRPVSCTRARPGYHPRVRSRSDLWQWSQGAAPVPCCVTLSLSLFLSSHQSGGLSYRIKIKLELCKRDARLFGLRYQLSTSLKGERIFFTTSSICLHYQLLIFLLYVIEFDASRL